MTQDNMPDRIYASFFVKDESGNMIIGGWDVIAQPHDTPYLKATPAREAAEDMLEALVHVIGTCRAECPNGLDALHHARAAIAKAQGKEST